MTTENQQLQDSLILLKKQLLALDSVVLEISPLEGKLDPSFDDTIISRSENQITVKFIPKTINADKYSWSFGDNTNSKEPLPVHTYKISGNNKFKVSLEINKNKENAKDSRILEFTKEAIADAAFDYRIISERAAYVTYKFTPLTRDADSYKWYITDTLVGESKKPDMIYTFKKSASNSIKIKLIISKNNKSFESYKYILIQAFKPKITLAKNDFCTNDNQDYLFQLDPSGGKVTGNGVISKNNQYYFNPSSKQVTPGIIKFIYEISGIQTNYNITVKKCHQRITFTLPGNEFYKCDKNQYSFTTNPYGGVVEGSGVVRKGEAYFFVPANAGRDKSITFTYRVLDTTVHYTVVLKDISASFSQTSKKDTNGITYTLRANEKSMDEYSWSMKVNNEIVKRGSGQSFSVFFKNSSLNMTMERTLADSVSLTIRKGDCNVTNTQSFFR